MEHQCDLLDGVAQGGFDSSHGPKPLKLPQHTLT